MRYGVWCQVSGGITGYRYGWLKRGGVRQEFSDRGEAMRIATQLNTERNKPIRRALFAYQVLELTGENDG